MLDLSEGAHQRGKVGEFDSGQGKVRKVEKVREKSGKMFCLCYVTAIAMVTE